MDELNEHYDDLFWHALNYRTAATQNAQEMWKELEKCVERKVKAVGEPIAKPYDLPKPIV